MYIEDETIKNLHSNTFKGINLSYGYMVQTKFENIVFSGMIFNFTTFYKVNFTNCTFLFTTFYGSNLENVSFVNCDFLDKAQFRNCLLKNVRFNSCFFENNVFNDCQFDEATRIDSPLRSSRFSKKQINLDMRELSGIYKGIKEGYLSGEILDKKRDYYFLERQVITRYNLDKISSKIGNYFLEYVSGYGIRPFRVLYAMILSFIFFTALFVGKIGYPDGLLLSTGAYFTNGANSNLLSTMGPFYQSIYLLESFLGILLIALFITVMANLWFNER